MEVRNDAEMDIKSLVDAGVKFPTGVRQRYEPFWRTLFVGLRNHGSS